MKKKYLLIVTVFLSLFLLVGCGGKDNALVGEWKGLTDGESRDMQIETTFNFKSNGDVEYSNEFGINSTGTYEIKDDIVTIKLESWESAKDYKFEVKDDKLSLTAQDVYSPSYSEMVKQ